MPKITQYIFKYTNRNKVVLNVNLIVFENNQIIHFSKVNYYEIQNWFMKLKNDFTDPDNM